MIPPPAQGRALARALRSSMEPRRILVLDGHPDADAPRHGHALAAAHAEGAGRAAWPAARARREGRLRPS
jgi:hypothetical protein